MDEPIAYLNGEWVPFSEARLSVADYGVVQAATVTEMIRTFRHRPFRVAAHLERLRRSLAETGIADPAIVETLPTVIERLVAENAPRIDIDDDLGITAFVTAGINATYAEGSGLTSGGPSVCVHSFTLRRDRWKEQYTHGLSLVIPSVRAIPPATIDPRIKYRSRLHWFLADREARLTDPQAMALLLDGEGHLTETSSGNIILFDGRTLRMPREECVLGGISQQVVLELAAAIDIAHRVEDLTVADLLAAEEAFVSSSSYCLLAVTRVNGKAIGSGKPGPLYQRLIESWSRLVEIDILGR